MDLKGKTVLVTGGARRIGRAIALEFAEKGAQIIVPYRGASHDADLLLADLQEYGVRAKTYRADLLETTQVLSMVENILCDFECVDILINNASSFYPTSFGTITEAHWDGMLGIHVKAPFFLAQALSPLMKEKGAGRIINIADWTGLRPRKDYLPYCVSKGALLTLTQALAKELAPEVLVTAVCPGPILPPESLDNDEDIPKRTLLKKWGDVEEIARLVLFLAEQNFATGSIHVMDGGESLV